MTHPELSCWAAHLVFGLLVSVALVHCPPDMAFASPATCIDVLPWPNYSDHAPLLGLSATPENYIALDGATWDLETLCASRGKRVCDAAEWAAACTGTPRAACPSQLLPYRAPQWRLVAVRDPFELFRLDRHEGALSHPLCVGASGARMMGSIQEWVRYDGGYAMSRGYWSREGGCRALNVAHDPRWHDYASGGRCCLDL